jgi:hypothetical protein
MGNYKRAHFIPNDTKYLGTLLMMLIHKLGFVLIVKWVKGKPMEHGHHKFKLITREEFEEVYNAN